MVGYPVLAQEEDEMQSKMKERTSSPLIADEENPDLGVFSLFCFVCPKKKIEIRNKSTTGGGVCVGE